MVIAADTSGLFSLYANDVHTSRILAWLSSQRQLGTLLISNKPGPGDKGL
jgi:hypothetical protein